MTGDRPTRLPEAQPPPPGDDVVPVPPPVTEEPPHDCFCDLVLTGGVASGVVYPWALVELARAFRFRRIGGTSVGAMAAAMAAAAEYGRRHGFEAPFEALRRAPADLGKDVGGRTALLALFQPHPRGRRLMAWWGQVFNGNAAERSEVERRQDRQPTFWRALGCLLRVYAWPIAFGVLVAELLTIALPPYLWETWRIEGWTLAMSMLVAAIFGALGGLLVELYHDIHAGITDNNYGLCKGARDPDGAETHEGLTDWLHRGIQRSAGLKPSDRPLTFGDLWTAPLKPGARRVACGDRDPAAWRSIDLKIMTTNLTHGRPYCLPERDRTSRLFFLASDLEGYFPAEVMAAMAQASVPYAPAGAGDPPATEAPAGLRELPGAGLPLVVAARLSLSFPVLFSAVPLWAIDYEPPRGARRLRRCFFSDGGVSSNFPIHLFDSAVPRWPTFGLWLDQRTPFVYPERDPNAATPEERVWLPPLIDSGKGDSWDRFDPRSDVDALDTSAVKKAPPAYRPRGPDLVGFLLATLTSAKDWHDRTLMRLPHVRNRVARLLLLPDEGGLHIGMSRKQILEMAHNYGTRAGRAFVADFAPKDGKPSAAWNQQRWVRFNVLVNALREQLRGLSTGAAWSAHTTPLRTAFQEAVQHSPVITHPSDVAGAAGIPPVEAARLAALLDALETAERQLTALPTVFSREPEPEARLQAPL